MTPLMCLYSPFTNVDKYKKHILKTQKYVLALFFSWIFFFQAYQIPWKEVENFQGNSFDCH